jgi:hypothetical protein
MRPLVLVLLLGLGHATLSPGLTAGDPPGAAEMVLPGGSSGNVPFPHHRHQESLKDCAICHAHFPQQAAAIQTLKAQGTLEPKQVMNKLCTACHKQKKNSGEQTGPITCTGCHQK